MTAKLFCNPSPSLLVLYRADQIPLDGLECTPFQSPRRMASLRTDYAGLPFQFHAGNVGRTPLSQVKLRRYLQACPETRWVSLHLSLVPAWALFFALRFGIRLPLPPADRLEARLVRRVAHLIPALRLPVILENMPANRVLKNAFESDPAMIRRVLDGLDVGLLLDLAHARVAATFHQLDVRDYLAQLPLERVRQIHLSGAREVGGVLQDAHETLSEADYDLFQWTLSRTRPEIVTLEYYRDDQPALQEMLVRLRHDLEVYPPTE